MFREVEKRNFKVNQLKGDKVHLNQKYSGTICFILTAKILRSAFDVDLDKQGKQKFYKCSGSYHCGVKTLCIEEVKDIEVSL